MLSDSDHWAYSPRKATCHIASLWFVQGDCGSGLGASALTPDSCICGLSGFCCHQQALLGSAGRSVQRLFRLKASSSYGLSGFILVCFRVSWASKTGRKKKSVTWGPLMPFCTLQSSVVIVSNTLTWKSSQCPLGTSYLQCLSRN